VLEIGIREASVMNSAITLKVYEFPFINLLWIGVIIMVAGFFISIRYRYKMTKRSTRSIEKNVEVIQL